MIGFSKAQQIRHKPKKKKCRVNQCARYGNWKTGICPKCTKMLSSNRKTLKKVKSQKTSARDRAKAAFQKYCRYRDSNSQGLCSCITCGRLTVWNKNTDGGHYRPAFFNNTCFDERNCNSQCKTCNRARMQTAETIDSYTRNIDKKWGLGTAEDLQIKSHIEKRFTDLDYNGIELYFKNKFNELKKQRDYA